MMNIPAYFHTIRSPQFPLPVYHKILASSTPSYLLLNSTKQTALLGEHKTLQPRYHKSPHLPSSSPNHHHLLRSTSSVLTSKHTSNHRQPLRRFHLHISKSTHFMSSTSHLPRRHYASDSYRVDHEIQALIEEGVKPPQYIQYLEVCREVDPYDTKRLLYFTLKYKESTKMELATSCSLSLRDLRSITLPDANLRQIATIIVRGSAIVVHMGPLQVIIKEDRLLCFNLEHPLMRSLIKDFVLKINKTSPSNPIFEMRVLESLLIELMQYLEYSYNKIVGELTLILDRLLISQTVQQLQSLLDYSIRLNDFHEGVLQIQSALFEILNSDEDMAMMYLSAKPPRDVDNHAEFEMLLEAFHHTVTEVDNRLKQYQNRIRVTEEYIKIHFEGQRNRLLRIGLIVSFATLSISIPAFGASLFGMNLFNKVEQHPEMFITVTSTLCAIGISTFLAAYSYYLSTKSSSSLLSTSTKMSSINWWESTNSTPVSKSVLQQRALQEEKNKKYYNYDAVGNINLAEIHHLQYFYMKELENEDSVPSPHDPIQMFLESNVDNVTYSKPKPTSASSSSESSPPIGNSKNN